jgi:alkylhydroperoxidase/carboxymuconolactone decarboxylase family protein YurZ
MEQGSPTPMDLLKQIALEFAQNQFDQRALLFESPKYQAVPLKYKLLAGISVAAALGSVTCTEMWTKMALQKEVNAAEISEVILVARYMKMATVNDTASSPLQML